MKRRARKQDPASPASASPSPPPRTDWRDAALCRTNRSVLLVEDGEREMERTEEEVWKTTLASV